MDCMGDIFPKPQPKEATSKAWEKLVLLTSDFGRLEDGQKDYILELTRKLVGIHCGGEYGDAVVQKAVSPFQI